MHFKAKIPWELGYGKDKNGHIPPCTDLEVELKVYEILEDVDDDEEDLVKGTVLYKVLESGNCEAEKGGGLYLDGDKTYTFHTEYEMHILKEDGEEIMIGKVPFDDDDYPYRFRSGEHTHVITGWDHMFDNMCVGEKRRAVVPHTMTFAENKVPEHMRDTIGPFDDLIFVYRLLEMDMSVTTAEELKYEQEAQEKAEMAADHEASSGFGGGEF